MRRVTAGCLLLAWITWFCAFRVDRFQMLDARVLNVLDGLDSMGVEAVVAVCSAVIQPPAYAVLCLGILWLGARAAGLRAALAAGVAMLGANVTTQLLKRALAEPRVSELFRSQVDPVSWPSGHATASTIALLAALLLSPARVRPAVLLFGGAWAAIVCAGVLVNHWHYPSDVLGGLLVAGAWGSAAAWVSSRRPAPAATAAPRRRWLRATG